jgi:hypothetical protein
VPERSVFRSRCWIPGSSPLAARKGAWVSGSLRCSTSDGARVLSKDCRALLLRGPWPFLLVPCASFGFYSSFPLAPYTVGTFLNLPFFGRQRRSKAQYTHATAVRPWQRPIARAGHVGGSAAVPLVSGVHRVDARPRSARGVESESPRHDHGAGRSERRDGGTAGARHGGLRRPPLDTASLGQRERRFDAASPRGRVRHLFKGVGADPARLFRREQGVGASRPPSDANVVGTTPCRGVRRPSAAAAFRCGGLPDTCGAEHRACALRGANPRVPQAGLGGEAGALRLAA